jgi:hypothetical protein
VRVRVRLGVRVFIRPRCVCGCGSERGIGAETTDASPRRNLKEMSRMRRIRVSVGSSCPAYIWSRAARLRLGRNESSGRGR